MIFAVFDPSPLTVCINCSFFTFIAYSDREREFTFAKKCVTSESRQILYVSGIYCDDRLPPNGCESWSRDPFFKILL